MFKRNFVRERLELIQTNVYQRVIDLQNNPSTVRWYPESPERFDADIGCYTVTWSMPFLTKDDAIKAYTSELYIEKRLAFLRKKLKYIKSTKLTLRKNEEQYMLANRRYSKWSRIRDLKFDILFWTAVSDYSISTAAESWYNIKKIIYQRYWQFIIKFNLRRRHNIISNFLFRINFFGH